MEINPTHPTLFGIQRPALVVLVCLIALGASLGQAQTAPSGAPSIATPPPVVIPAAPPVLTAAQTAVLQGPLEKMVAQLASTTGIKLVPVPAGTFLMGSPAQEAGRARNEGPQTSVTFSRPFFLGATGVTQAQWSAVMGSNPSFFKGETLPVENVSWDDAVAFCAKLTARERAAGHLPEGYQLTLPTEAQREYVCRAGTTGQYAGDIDALAWYFKNCDAPQPVGTKQPNAWGLYDMEGNVWEWCLDWFEAYPGGVVTDPTGPATGDYRVFRGGTWANSQVYCRAASRFYNLPTTRNNDLGLRVALVMPAPAK